MMTPTNQQLSEHLKQLGNKLDETGEFLESVAFALANQYKLIADKLPELSNAERDALRLLAQQALDGVKKHTLQRRLLRDLLHIASQN
jgi:hypothetical protein